jgi:3',5'-cyclic AMP phosphodiesterase CpdA
MKPIPLPKDTYRIAHLSDLHLTGVNRDFECSLALVEDATELGAEHIVISGDLVESGEMGVLKNFVAALKRLGWAGSNRLTIIPGNHDIFPATYRKMPSLRRPTSIYEDFVAITRGSRTGKGFRSLRRGVAYPFGKVLNERVVLVGLDTTRNDQWLPTSWASGELSEEQMTATDEFFSDWSHIPHRIIVMHHHPWRENFVGGNLIEQNFVKPPPEEVLRWLHGSRATLVLCGHVHQKDSIEKVSFGKHLMILRAGTAGGVNDITDGDKRRIYHLLDLNPTKGIRIHAREFRDSEI